VNFIDEQQLAICQSLGNRLRQLRIQHNEPQAIFAERMGVSRQTFAKMERGHPSTPIGLWVRASSLLNCENEWAHIFKEEQSLFEQFEQTQKPQRQRASRVKTGRAKK